MTKYTANDIKKFISSTKQERAKCGIDRKFSEFEYLVMFVEAHGVTPSRKALADYGCSESYIETIIADCDPVCL